MEKNYRAENTDHNGQHSRLNKKRNLQKYKADIRGSGVQER